MADINIRPALPAEATELTNIAKRAKAHWGYAQHLLALWVDALTVQPEDCDGTSVWLLEADNEIAGFGRLVMIGTTGILDDLWIDPVCMGKGYGKSLFQHLRDLAASRGATRLSIEADPHAVAFYEGMGARIVGENPSDTVPGRVLPLMELVLHPPENTTISTER